MLIHLFSVFLLFVLKVQGVATTSSLWVPKHAVNTSNETQGTKVRNVALKVSGDRRVYLLSWDEILHLGCYYRWEGHSATGYHQYGDFFMEKSDPQRCLSRCLQGLKFNSEFYKYDVAMVKDLLCGCMIWDIFKRRISAELILSEYCSMNCDVLDPSSAGQEPSCGGNTGVSIYCPRSNQYCEESLREDEGLPLRDYNLSLLTDPDFISAVARSKLCVVCTGHCDLGHKASFYPAVDYFPLLTPEACVLNCKKIHQDAVAFLTWFDAQNEHETPISMPFCACQLNYPNSTNFRIVGNEYCNTACPGKEEEDQQTSCGSVHFRIYHSVLCVDTEDADCVPFKELGSTTQSSSLDPSTTSFWSSDGSTSSERVRRSSSSESSTASFWSSEGSTSSEIVRDRSSSGSSGVFTTPSIWSSTMSTKSSLTTTTPRFITTTSTRRTTTTSTLATTEKKIDCIAKCVADFNDIQWRACPGQTASRRCGQGATGRRTWVCLESLSFATTEPVSTACNTDWLLEVEEEFRALLAKENNSISLKDSGDLLQTMTIECSRTATNQILYYGHEIKLIADLMLEIVITTQAEDGTQFRTLLDQAVNLSGILLANKEPWEDLYDVSIRAEAGRALFKSLEQTVLLLSEFPPTEDATVSFTSDCLKQCKFLVTYGTRSQDENVVFPLNSGESTITVVKESFSDPLNYIGYSIDSELIDGVYLPALNSLNEGMRADPSKVFNSKVLSLTLSEQGTNDYHTSIAQDFRVRIRFQHNVDAFGKAPTAFRRKLHPNETRKMAIGTAVCVFWSADNLWSPDGCELVKITRTYSVCECNHLTTFAILMDQHEYVGRNDILEWITFILCPISIVCLIMSIVIFSTVDSIKSRRTVITKNLCFCLMVGMVLVLFFVDKNYFSLPWEACQAIAIATHYIYLAAFMWMWIEGVHLYKMVVQVFDNGRNLTVRYIFLGYGIPIVIVSGTYLAGYLLEEEPYGGDLSCWLVGVYTWSFEGPVAVVVLSNVFILCVALRAASTMKVPTMSQQVRQRSCRAWIHGCMSVTVLLGLTWIPGFLMAAEITWMEDIAAYLFVLLNASQGIFVFIFHIVLNERLRKGTGRNIPFWSSLQKQKGKNDASVKKR